jgi:serine/threonine-protein kinase
MTKDNLQRIEALFDAALEQPAARRQAWLVEACPDAAERGQVERLLASMTASGEGRFIDAAMLEAARGLSDPNVLAGQQFGPWRLIREVGQGGMGSVWLAERADEAYSAQVAIKFVRGAFFSPDLARRFRAERQILADLQHPNIARLVDGGAAPDGTPFLAMEFVPGEPITQYAWSNGLDLEARLRLFITVCDAVQHAHRALVVHRDLKPSNILVGRDGIPKLVDFGIAKLLDAASTDETTALVRPMTPAYASPEQVRGERVTVSSDVFSLGVVLYELLTGEQPFRSGSGPANDVQRQVLETEPPLPSAAAARASDHTKFVAPRSLSGDLDNIVMMALRKEAERRYPTVEHLADDVRHHLAGQPVRARPSTAGYRLRKFVRRNRVGVSATVAGILLVTALVTFYTVRLQRERDVAQRERETAEQATTFLTDMFRTADPTRALGETLTVRQALDRGLERLATELADQPRVRARLLSAIGNTYANLAAFAPADTVLRETLALVEETMGPDDAQTAGALENLARLETLRGNYEAGLAHAQRALAIRERVGEARGLASALSLVGVLLLNTGGVDSARTVLDRAIALAESAPEPHAADLATMRYNRAITRVRNADYRGAIDELRLVQQIRDSVLPVKDPQHGQTANVMAVAWGNLGERDSARVMYERALSLHENVYGLDHPQTATAFNNLGVAMQQLGLPDSAQVLLQRALDIRTRYFGEKHAAVANTLMTIANTWNRAGEYEAAIPYYERANAIYDEVLPAGHRDSYFPRYNLGVALNSLERWAAAESHLRRALDIATTAMGPAHPSTGSSKYSLGVAVKALGDTAGAKQLFAESLAIFEAALGIEHVNVTYPLESLAETHLQQHEWARATELYAKGLVALEKRYAADASSLASALENYARGLREIDQIELADSLEQRASELRGR